MVSCAPGNTERLEALCGQHGVPVFRAGRVGRASGDVTIHAAGQSLTWSIPALRKIYFEAIPRRMRHPDVGSVSGSVTMCGIIGVSGIPDAARLAYLGLYALQHRGQESAGIVAVDREGVAREPPRNGTGERELRRVDAGPAAGRRGGGPYPLQHHRKHGAGQRAALQRQHALRPSRHRAQRQSRQCRRPSSASWWSAAPSSPARRTPKCWCTSSPGRKPTPWKVRSAMRWNRWMAPTASSSPSAARSTPSSTVAGFALSSSGASAAAWWWPPRVARSTCSAPPPHASCSRVSSSASTTARSPSCRG